MTLNELKEELDRIVAQEPKTGKWEVVVDLREPNKWRRSIDNILIDYGSIVINAPQPQTEED